MGTGGVELGGRGGEYTGITSPKQRKSTEKDIGDLQAIGSEDAGIQENLNENCEQSNILVGNEDPSVI